MQRIIWIATIALVCAQQPNGMADDISDFVKTTEYMVPMRDGVRLSTLVVEPVFSDTIAFNVNMANFGMPALGTRKIRFAYPGQRYLIYPDQSDPYALPVLWLRTPYGKEGEIAIAAALLGYVGIEQDTRGRYRSEGVYFPLYSDSWEKTAYVSHLGPGAGHPLDITPNKEANTHEDGWDSYRWILDSLRYDGDGDGQISATDPLLCNGKIGMYGTSALGYTQYQLAAAHPIDPNGRGLKALVPVVATGEFSYSAAHHNGVFRERLVDGWVRRQMEFYNYVPGPANVYDALHTLADYGDTIQSGLQAAEIAIDFWSTMYGVHYPNSPARALWDISHATLDANGNPQWRGPRSRYENMQVPMYHYTGWWDIFIDGTIQTWSYLMRHLPPSIKKYQKLIIGPYAHQTVGGRSTGDMRILPDGRDHRYPPNVIETFNLTDLTDFEFYNAARIVDSEMFRWFRYFLGTPTFQLLPDTAWQYLGNNQGVEMWLRVPADTFRTSYYEFFNFMNGTQGMRRLPIHLVGLREGNPNDTVQNLRTRINFPPTGSSFFGDTSGLVVQDTTYPFDATLPNGIKNVRFYVVGPVADSLNDPPVGNYWISADTFPLPGLPRLRLYLHGDGTLTDRPPTAPEPERSFISSPITPVLTHGGPNMIVRTPDGQRFSQGQMDFADPRYRHIVLDRPAQYEVNGKAYTDLISYESGPIQDSLCIAGFSVAELYVSLKPLWGPYADSANGDIIVRVLDVYPDGRQYYVFEGACNARAREYAESIADGQEDTSRPWYNLVADSVYKWRFRTLPIAYCWGKGHRIKILISGTNYPRYQACPNVPLMPGEFFRRRPRDYDKTYLFHGVPLRARQNLQTIHSTPDKPSYIELPILGGRFATQLETAESTLPSFRLYPNPAREYAFLEADKPGIYEVEVQTLTGQTVFRGDFTHTLNLPISQWSSGVYILRVRGQHMRTALPLKLIVTQ